MKRETHTIDATGQAPGRLASQIAVLLRGKNKPEYLPHVDIGCRVVVENVDAMKITGKKMNDKMYYHYSGYQGGLKETPMKRLVENKGMSEVLRRAVWNMLPKNKLRNNMFKRLVIK